MSDNTPIVNDFELLLSSMPADDRLATEKIIAEELVKVRSARADRANSGDRRKKMCSLSPTPYVNQSRGHLAKILFTPEERKKILFDKLATLTTVPKGDPINPATLPSVSTILSLLQQKTTKIEVFSFDEDRTNS